MRRALLVVAIITLIGVPFPSSAQTCGFPWTVMATPSGASSATVSVCGLYVGCRPHNQQFTVDGSRIEITYQTSEPPDGCQCIQVQGTLQDTVVVTPLPSGIYTVTVTLLSCDAPQVVGSGTLAQGAVQAIPVLGLQGLIALVALVGVAGVMILRR